RLMAARSWFRTARSKDLACFLSCSRLARSGNCDVIKTSMLWPEVRNQAARDLDVHWKFFDSGLSPSREPAGARSAHKLNITKFFTRSSVDKALLPHQRHGTQTRPVLSG